MALALTPLSAFTRADANGILRAAYASADAAEANGKSQYAAELRILTDSLALVFVGYFAPQPALNP